MNCDAPHGGIAKSMDIAIIDPNTAACRGLQSIIGEVAGDVTVRMFPDFGALADDTPYAYDLYFVTSQAYVLYNKFFIQQKDKTVVLTYGRVKHAFFSSSRLLDLYDSEDKIKKKLKLIFKNRSIREKPTASEEDLSPREIEVLVLIAKGFMNKEIADRLGISLTTVISHRKNIVEKLGIKSVSGLTIYAVMNGYVSPDVI